MRQRPLASSEFDDPFASKLREVVVLAPSFPPAMLAGGPTRSIDALVTTCPATFRTWVITPDRDLGATEAMPVSQNAWIDHGRHRLLYCTVTSTPRLFRALRDARAVRPALVYINGMFHARLALLPLLLHRVGFWRSATLIVAPRGQLAPSALAKSSRKKKLLLRAFKSLQFDRDLHWHSTSPRETEAIRSMFGTGIPLTERANETSLPPTASEPQATETIARAAFVARIVPIKGLHLLLAGLMQVRDPLVVDIIGPEEDAVYAQECRSIAAELPSQVTVNFLGEASPDSVRDLMSTYDALLFPTAGENFGHAIVEALSASCIVFCHDTTPWTPVLHDGGGTVVGQTADAWASAMGAFAQSTAAERAEQRRSAGAAYGRWAAADKPKHLFSLVLDREAESVSGA